MQVGSVLVGTVVAMVLAVADAGIRALVFGELASAAALSLLGFAAGRRAWRPAFRFRRGDLAGYLGFGLNQLGERTLNAFGMNVDYLLVGRVWGPTTLGLYTVAFELASAPTRFLNPVFTRVAFPLFARMQSDKAALARGFVELTRLLALL
ncbi:MAG: oligosaccharide flippase family protein, partial [candidate division KSB1 bacterium]|nr:oligosaccharide flippase family protein [candidate division KSB1 bacterium]